MSQRLPATARREQILDVALDVFATSGFHGSSMNDVAEAAGVTKPVLYQHFDSKRELYQALIDDVGNRLLDQHRQGDRRGHRRQEPDRTRLPRLLPLGRRRPRRASDCCSAPARRRRRVQRRRAQDHRRGGAGGRAADRRRHRRIDIGRTFAHALVGMAEGASRRLVELGDDFDPDEIATEVVDLAWAGLRAV